MARKRMLDPTFFTSSTVNELTIPAMVTFAGLWTYCDDYGRGEDDPALIKAALWPRRRAMTEPKVISHVGELVAQNLVCRYDVAGYALLHIPSWHEHQKISHRTDSKLPPCAEHEGALFESFANDIGGPLDKFRRISGKAREALHDSSVEVSSDQSSSRDTDPPAPERIADIRRRGTSA